ncbi:MAG: hypothetical protein AB7E46_10735 [Desulfovibrio sp.]|jgi:hypothetical protein
MSASTKKTTAAAAKAPARKTQAAVPATKAPAKTPARKASSMVPAKAPAKKAPPARKTSREAMLARVEAVRMEQRSEGHFDCFGRAGEGYCDQGACAYHAECLSVSRMMHSL